VAGHDSLRDCLNRLAFLGMVSGSGKRIGRARLHLGVSFLDAASLTIATACFFLSSREKV
jgi:hypothetical protein